MQLEKYLQYNKATDIRQNHKIKKKIHWNLRVTKEIRDA